MSDDLLDLVYEAAVIPERWRDVCGRLAEHTGSFSCALITVDLHGDLRWISTPNIDDALNAYAASDLRFQNVRPQRKLSNGVIGFERDIDVMTLEEIENDPIYRSFMRPIGLGWTMGDTVAEPSGHIIIFDLIRSMASGPHSKADLDAMAPLRGALMRAALMTSRLAFREARSMTDSLGLLGLAALVVDQHGAVLAMNDEMETQSPVMRTGARNRLVIGNPVIHAMVHDALGRISARAAPTVQSIPVPGDESSGPRIIHVVPVRRAARDIFTRAAAVVIVTPVGAAGVLEVGILSGLFDLTTSEARVAREIAAGATPDDAAVRLGISLETVRSHLKRIFAKTGTRRQAELARLLTGGPGLAGVKPAS